MTANTGSPPPSEAPGSDPATAREWLETNGLGGYAASTIAGLNTRRYHGLLVAATKPPVGRRLLLSKLEETLVIGGERYELSSNRYPGGLHPEGWRFLAAFRPDPFPTWLFEAGGVKLERTLFMVHGENTTVLTWRLLSSGEARLEVRPLIAFRDIHALTHENAALDPRVAVEPGAASVAPYPGLPVLHVAHDGDLALTGHWYRSFEYEEDRRRGFDFTEDLFQPFVLTFHLDASTRSEATVIASTRRRTAADLRPLRENESARREALAGRMAGDGTSLPLLARAADQFLVQRDGGASVIAGYPWFSDWGRNAMIALPGLTLATGRPKTGREVLLVFARSASEGLIPGRFLDEGDSPAFDAADATLWFVEAVRRLVEATADTGWVREHLWGVLTKILEAHVAGTRFGLRLDDDGLLLSAAPGLALTWMDARVSGQPVTPRRGKPVEIEALWYSALRTLEELADRFGEEGTAARIGAMAARAKESFLRLFPNGSGGLFDVVDVVDGLSRDASVRPNQIFAASLAHSMLGEDEARSVVSVVTRQLLTPFGLRTLSPADPAYVGRYEGDAASRDRAYHQGTVWPWLMGPYVDAFLRVEGHTPGTRRRARRTLSPLLAFFGREGTGQLPELFDGDPPHRPAGCPAQAWSVAELLRALRRAAD
ncbi:MAG: amylo-alpha-1,6-glucosidase [Acidithiobacillales bacterium]